MNLITIRLSRNYDVEIDGVSSWWLSDLPFNSMEAALISATKYLKQCQIEEKQNLRGPN